MNKPHLPPGPWQNEPDRVEFKHAGLPCLMVRHPQWGHWCGYAAVPPGHPYHGKGYDEADVEVHGDLTYANKCDGEICHKPEPGEPDDVYWFGFDCVHAFDLSPGHAAVIDLVRELAGMALRERPVELREEYRDMSYVRSEVEKLAEQLAAVTEATSSSAPL